MIDRIPNYTTLRLGKFGYEMLPIDTEHPLHNDPLVDLREIPGFEDATSYYSQPNKMNGGEPLPGIPNAPLVRLDVAKRLRFAQSLLETDADIREALGAPARLQVVDALRPHLVQKYAFEVAWPRILAERNPGLSPAEIAALVATYCARPSDYPTPTPHQTGGAIDVRLVNRGTNQPFDRGHIVGSIGGTAYPDFHEGYHLVPNQSDIKDTDPTHVASEGSEIVIGRRTLHYVMNRAGLYVNPTEIWHYDSAGDPLGAYLSGSNHPYYGVAELPEAYAKEMSLS